MPAPLFGRGRIFAGKGFGQVNFAASLLKVFTVHDLDAGKMLLEGLAKGVRQHGDAVFVTFAVADDDLAASEVDIFDAQAQAFHKPHAGAVEKLGDQLSRSLHRGKNPLNFGFAQNDGDPMGAASAHEAVHPVELHVEDFAVEKDHGVERLILSRRGDVLVQRQIGKECLNFGSTHFTGMTLLVEKDVTLDPSDVGVLGMDGVMFDAEDFADLVEEFGLGIGNDPGGGEGRFSSAS